MSKIEKLAVAHEKAFNAYLKARYGTKSWDRAADRLRKAGEALEQARFEALPVDVRPLRQRIAEAQWG